MISLDRPGQDRYAELVGSLFGTGGESGGRMIDAILTNTMLPDISREFLNRMLDGREIAGIDVAVGEGRFQYRFHD